MNLHQIEKETDLSAELLFKLDEKYKPVQIVLEYNSFYTMENLEFPEYMPVYQQVTLIDASTFGLYFNNMRQVFNNLVKLSSLIIFNRCDGVTDLGLYRRQIRALNQECQIGFEGKNGQLTSMLDEDLPYDITKDTIILEDTDYPTWYIDVFDNYEKYLGKTIKFKTFVRDILEDSIVVGRNVMTCCEDDIQFLGYEVKNVKELVAIGDCIFLECEVFMNIQILLRLRLSYYMQRKSLNWLRKKILFYLFRLKMLVKGLFLFVIFVVYLYKVIYYAKEI